MATATEPLAVPRIADATGSACAASPSSLTLDDLYRLSADEYEQMGRAGLLEDARVELIDGLLVRKMPPDPPHVSVVQLVREAIQPFLPVGWHFREEKPVKLPKYNMPEPDMAIVRGTIRDYLDHHPGPGEIALLVEVAYSSISRDRKAKLAVYAGSGFAEYWIVNVIEERLEVYGAPDPAQRIYKNRRDFGRDESVTLTIEGRELGQIRISDLLP
jgi:Uma2 family endonuclease